MRYQRWALPKRLCAAALLCGCTSSLDFDAASAGSRAEADRGAVDGAVPEGIVGEAGVTGRAMADAAVDLAFLDAPPSPAPSAPFSCTEQQPAPAFCDDFESLGVRERWTDVVLSAKSPVGGSIEIDAMQARDGQRSLLAVAHEGIRVPWFAIAALRTFDEIEGKPARIQVDFDMKVEQIDATPGRRVMVAQFLFGNLVAGYNQVMLQLESTGPSVSAQYVENVATEGERDFDSRSGEPSPMELDQWAHVQLLLNVGNPAGSGNHVVLKLDERELANRRLSFALRELEPRLEVGLPWVDTETFTDQEQGQSWRVRFDNVLVRIEPK